MVKEITPDPRLATKKLLSYDYGKTGTKISAIQALWLIIEANPSRRQYDLVRHSYKNLYPSYSVQQKKRSCYPDKDSYRVTNFHASPWASCNGPYCYKTIKLSRSSLRSIE